MLFWLQKQTGRNDAVWSEKNAASLCVCETVCYDDSLLAVIFFLSGNEYQTTTLVKAELGGEQQEK